MATFTTSEQYGANPIIDSSLILCMDAANPKSYSNYNMLPYSQNFSNAQWVKGNSAVVSTNNLAPDGTNTATFIRENNTNSSHYLSWQVSPTAVTSEGYKIYNMSVYLKAGTRNFGYVYVFDGVDGGSVTQVFDLVNGTKGVVYLAGANNQLLDSSIQKLGNGWYRCSIIALINKNGASANGGFSISNTNSILPYLGDNTSGIYAWGAQLTEGMELKPYQVNTTTRPTLVTNLVGSQNGTLTNGTILSVGNGGQFNFDGTDDYITLGTPINTGQDFTVEVWVKPTAFGAARNALIANSYDFTVGTLNGWQLLLVGNAAGRTNTFALTIGKDTRTSGNMPSNIITLNKWTHLVATVTNGGTNISMYCDGLLVQSNNNTPITINYSTINTCYIGRREAASPEYFQGSMATPKVYNRTLTSAEVWQNYTATKDRFKK